MRPGRLFAKFLPGGSACASPMMISSCRSQSLLGALSLQCVMGHNCRMERLFYKKMLHVHKVTSWMVHAPALAAAMLQYRCVLPSFFRLFIRKNIPQIVYEFTPAPQGGRSPLHTVFACFYPLSHTSLLIPNDLHQQNYRIFLLR